MGSTGAVSNTESRRGLGQIIGGTVVAGAIAGFALLFVLSLLLFYVPSFWGSVLIALCFVVAALWFPAKSLVPRWVLILGPVLFLLPILFIALRPLGDDPINPKPAPWNEQAWQGTEVAYWDLSTGSRIGYVHFAPDDPNDAEPIVFLHGGPGGGIVPTDADFARRLTAEGFDVYLYDQAGVGWSDLLDVDDYTIERMVADLEAIRMEIGAERLNLIGHSWGGALATHYLVEHDDRVERAWLTNPGEFGGTPALRSPEEEPDLTAAKESGIPLNGRPPERFFMVYLLGVMGAQTGVLEDLVSQEQMVRYTPDYVDTVDTFQSSRCADNPYERSELDYVPATNFNFYVNMKLNRAVAEHDETDGLKAISTPMVIARGMCDHIPWDAQRNYRDNVPGAQLIVIPDEGHDMRPTTEIAAFFQGGDPGVEPYTSDDVPSPG